MSGHEVQGFCDSFPLDVRCFNTKLCHPWDTPSTDQSYCRRGTHELPTSASRRFTTQRTHPDTRKIRGHIVKQRRMNRTVRSKRSHLGILTHDHPPRVSSERHAGSRERDATHARRLDAIGDADAGGRKRTPNVSQRQINARRNANPV